MVKTEKLNLTIGAFEIAYSDMFIVEDGKLKPALNTLHEILDNIGIFGNFEISLKIAHDGSLGQLNGNIYETGVLGMLQRQEIDILFLPLPLDTPNPPGSFSPVIHDDVYHIYSFPRKSLSVTQNITTSLQRIHISLWSTYLIVIFMLEMLNLALEQLSRSNQRNKTRNLALSFIETIVSFACTLFSQHVPGRSILRTVQIIGIMMFTVILSASFSTSTIVGNDEAKIDTLRDVIVRDKTPLWLEGESVYELFQKGVTTDYAKIYRMGQEKGTQVPLPISSLDLIFKLGHDSVYFCSDEIARGFRKLAEIVGNGISKHEYKSKKPYYQASEAFLMNPLKNPKEIKQRIDNLSIKQIQGALYTHGFRKILNELLTSSPLGIKSHQMFLAFEGFQVQATIFQSLNLIGCKLVFIIWGLTLGVALNVFLLEIFCYQL